MNALVRISCFAIAFLTFSGCTQKREPAPTAEDLRVARHAMPISEVSLMLRNGFNEKAIMAEVTRRRVSEKPDTKTEDSLLRSGASTAFIQALKTDGNVLTEKQRKAFYYLAKQRPSSAEKERVALEEVAPARLTSSEDVVKRTVQNLRNADAYKAQREALETRINLQEAQIRRLRANGYKESQLLYNNETLDSYRQQLRDLKEPMR